MNDTTTISLHGTEATRWEDEKARPMWSSSGSADVPAAIVREIERKRPLQRDGNTLLM